MAKLESITGAIIGAAFKVSNTLGSGFLEKVYENALALELGKSGLPVVQQHGIEVRHEGSLVGEFAADLLVAGCVLVELKAVRALEDIHLAQCIHYLKATGLEVCLLMNFGHPRLEYRRVVLG
nr:GxxExxY protein [uncultured Holophaga sp.]